MVLLQLIYFSRRHSPPKRTFGKGAREATWAAEQRTLLFFFLRKKKGDSHVVVIVPRPTVQLGKPMGTISSETLNPHTPQVLLVSGTSRNCNYSSRENLNLGCGVASIVSSHLMAFS